MIFKLAVVGLLCCALDEGGRADRVEAGLLPPVAVVAEATPRMSMQARMTHYGVPAVSVAVIENGRIAWSRAYGARDRDNPAPVTTETVFQAGSLSKPLTAALVLALQSDEQVSLDRPVEDYLRSWTLPSPAEPASPITLRQILSHSAGLTVHGFRGYGPDEPLPTLTQVLEGTSPANSEPVVRAEAPGRSVRYSGGGYVVAQQIIEDVTARPFAELMRERVFGPLGMNSSTFEQPLPVDWRATAAVGHGPEGDPIPGAWSIFPEQAAAGLWSTPTDLARFVGWLMTDTDDGLGAGIASAMMSPQAGADGSPLATPGGNRAGLGLVLDGEGQARRFSHAGSNPGQKAFFIGFPETGQGAVVMANADAAPPLIQEILRAIAAEYGWPERFQQTVEIVPVSADALRAHEGVYIFSPRGDDGPVLEIRVGVADGALRVDLPNGSLHTARPLGEGRFLDTQSGMPFVFDGAGGLRLPAIGVAASRRETAKGADHPGGGS